MKQETGPIDPQTKSIFGDLQDARLMYLKAALFLAIGLLCAGAIFAQNPTLTTAIALAFGIWAFCRLYYFCFYVVEKYIDPRFKFAGLRSVVVYLIRRQMKQSRDGVNHRGSD